MNASDLTFLGGLLLGLASSLHCAGMCGGIASSLIISLAPSDGRWNGLRVLLIAQSARISV